VKTHRKRLPTRNGWAPLNWINFQDGSMHWTGCTGLVLLLFIIVFAAFKDVPVGADGFLRMNSISILDYAEQDLSRTASFRNSAWTLGLILSISVLDSIAIGWRFTMEPETPTRARLSHICSSTDFSPWAFRNISWFGKRKFSMPRWLDYGQQCDVGGMYCTHDLYGRYC